MRDRSAFGVGIGIALAALLASMAPAYAQKRTAGPPPAKEAAPIQAPAPSTGQGAYTMGEIGRRAGYGQSGDWSVTAAGDGSLAFANPSNPSSWNAIIIQPPAVPYTVQLDVKSGIPAVDGHAVGAGITFAYRRASASQGPSYYAVMVAGDSVFVYRYDGSFTQSAQNTDPALGSGRRWNTVRVTVKQDGFTVAMNGQEFVSISDGTPMAGEVGVMVSGAGDAAFRNLRLQ